MLAWRRCTNLANCQTFVGWISLLKCCGGDDAGAGSREPRSCCVRGAAVGTGSIAAPTSAPRSLFDRRSPFSAPGLHHDSNVIERMCPRRDTEATREVHGAECETGHGAKDERLWRERVAK